MSEVEASQLKPQLDWVNQQKEAGLFEHTPWQKAGDALKNDPVGVAKIRRRSLLVVRRRRPGLGFVRQVLVVRWVVGWRLSG
ncbi:hypothetical protein [Burkholderia ubonensis]|uniref:hypothetical protein n=1 Tax=Burkholderia ubonensis TaxID=101571 RepID=UPI000AAC51E5|nr:hypothetical protein [Burkholderia ubonensis]